MQHDVLTSDQPSKPIQGTSRTGDRIGLTAAVLASNEVVRRGIEGLLRLVPEVGDVRECITADDFGALWESIAPDVVIVTATNADWLDYFQDSLRKSGAIVLLVVDQESIEELANHPSSTIGGYLWQPTLTAVGLREALGRRSQADLAMPTGLVQALLARASGADRRSRARPVNLTSREREVLTLLSKGLSNKQIARRLSISSHGAKRLVASVMLKLDAPNRTLAAVTAIRAGLVESD